jgi:glucose/arabinose dehydrogenase
MTRRAVPAVVALLLAACNGGGQPTYAPFTPTSPATTSPPSPTPDRPDLSAVRVRLVPVADLDSPLAMAVRSGDDRLFVAGQSGTVYALERGGSGNVPEVLDISSRITSGGEQGLLGLAFSPDGRFLYVNFTDTEGDTRVEEYRMRSDGSINQGSRREVLFVDQPFSNHNGGNLVFGPDGYLYIGLGDGGSGGDPMGNGQNLGTLLGKMLRIDPRPEGGRPYGIPPDNPFVGREGARPEIWSFGLRNPWRYSFDRETEDLWIGDVGQNAREEVDFEPAGTAGGRNYGWNAFEGSAPFPGGAPAPEGAVPPLIDYPLESGACAVTGGYVYRGTAIPSLRGAYLYADFCVGQVRALVQRNGRVVQRRDLEPRVEALASFGEDQEGELYVLSLSGSVSRLAPA